MSNIVLLKSIFGDEVNKKITFTSLCKLREELDGSLRKKKKYYIIDKQVSKYKILKINYVRKYRSFKKVILNHINTINNSLFKREGISIVINFPKKMNFDKKAAYIDILVDSLDNNCHSHVIKFEDNKIKILPS